MEHLKNHKYCLHQASTKSAVAKVVVIIKHILAPVIVCLFKPLKCLQKYTDCVHCSTKVDVLCLSGGFVCYFRKAVALYWIAPRDMLPASPSRSNAYKL